MFQQVTTDEGATMQAACRTIQLPRRSCALHRLHNSIRDNIPFDSKGGQPANRFVFNLTVKCRAIAGSFSNSFKKRQQWLGLAEELKCSTKALVVDVRTRWDYTYLMLKSFNDQEKLVKLFSLQYDVPHVLTKADWDLVKPTMYLLEPLHGFTKCLTAGCLLSQLYPKLKGLLVIFVTFVIFNCIMIHNS